MSKRVVTGAGWMIVKEGTEMVTIHLKDPCSVGTPAYRNAVASLCNVKHVQVICSFVN
ncbi:hypothetical protein EV210_11770 [Anaerospora hongkongensis]|uniref:Uncharacterized protein n=1 Tax=Anaerospora hongkongensis TaxID=244830 RepID=A0A4R1PZW9_9FIRM|nr:hypothetical protein [Anaerospora hongkongensis]TCL33612.1 hypothetical protein EV210_11770 [Anaerospora hongkongensis]